MNTKILITGSEGFIGSHIVERLVLKGYKVKALVLYNFNNSYGWLDTIDKKILSEVEVITGDIRDLSFLIRITKKVDVILHLAALISIPYSYQASYSNIETNVLGSYNILEASKINNIKKTIITSTSEVYGTAQKIPIDENHPINPQSPYAASKSAADKISLSYNKSFNLPICVIRPFNTFGPRQSLRAIIPTIISQIVSGKKIIDIGNVSPRRDFTFIEDTVDAFMLSINSKKIIGEEINLGNGFDISISEIIKILRNDFNFNFEIKVNQKRLRPKNSEVQRLIASNLKATKLLKWKPKYKGLLGFKKGLEKTIKWYENPNNLKYFKSNNYNI
jgi:NAD dependent epimerase/dehydratase